METNDNIPDTLKWLKQIENELLELIPKCTSEQLIKCEHAINLCLNEKSKLQKMQDEFIDELIKHI